MRPSSAPSLATVLTEEMQIAVGILRRLETQLAEIGDTRARLVASYPKVADYVKLHHQEGLVKDELTRAERKVCELAKHMMEML